ncbi:hypothetical protein NPIL_340171, partial [Nephila pilipes]
MANEFSIKESNSISSQLDWILPSVDLQNENHLLFSSFGCFDRLG